MKHLFQWPDFVRKATVARQECTSDAPAFQSRAVIFRKLVNFGLFFFAGVLAAVAGTQQETTNSNLLSIVKLQNTLAQTQRSVRSFRLEGVVRATVPQRNILALQDASGTMLLELPSVNSTLSVGERLAIHAAPCVLTRTRFGVWMDAFPVVDNDGIHSALEKSGTVFLGTGMNPIRVAWFNGPGDFALNLEYEGPGVSRQKVPASVLWQGLAGATNPGSLKSGVHYAAYEGNGWFVLPDFSRLNPVTEGVATNFSLTYRTRDQYCGLAFNGFIQIDHPGFYTFHLTSDDGSRLYVGKPSVSCEVITPPGPSVPAPESFEQALADRINDRWIQMEGEVTFVSENQRSLEIKMIVGGYRVPVTVVEGEGLFSTDLLHHWIRADGIYEFTRASEDNRPVGVFVPGSEQVKIYDSAASVRNDSTNHLLTMTAQVRRLNSTEASKHIPARIRGVVIYATSSAMVLQDSSGGVFIGSRTGGWADQPHSGELWEIEGTTGAGGFSRVVVADTAKFLGDAVMPEPIQPTLDQLMNGSLDAEYVELHGVLTAFSNTEMTLLTPDGRVTVVGDRDRPLPQLPKSVPGGGSLVDSVVQICGCFAMHVDDQTHQAIPGEMYLYPALVEVEDPSPLNPFLLPTRKTTDLKWFDDRAGALQRTKLAGQIIYALPGEYFVLDGKTGFRVLANNSALLKTGDLIEAVGFPKLGSPSPVLQEAQIRKTGHAALPEPVQVSPERLPDRDRDSTLVRVEAILISAAVQQDEEVLELQSGSLHFVAKLKSKLQPWPSLLAGSRLQLTGAYASADENQDYVGANRTPFELLLNSAADIVVLQQPPWWTLRRAVFATAVLAGALIVTFVWVALLRRKVEERTAQLKKEIEERQLVEQHHAVEQERTRVARDLHDELGAGLTEVGILGSLASTPAIAPETKDRYLNQLTQMASSLVNSLDEIVWAVNPHYDSAASLVSYFPLFAESFLELAEINCRSRVMSDIPECLLDSKVRHGVFCAFKEVLNNVVRHSGATEVQLVFQVVDNQLVLSVIDNGRGFEFVPVLPSKDGLPGLSQRMQQLGGDCQITSQPGRGTKVEIRLPLKKV